jgi:hypothetical protein
MKTRELNEFNIFSFKQSDINLHVSAADVLGPIQEHTRATLGTSIRAAARNDLPNGNPVIRERNPLGIHNSES